MVQRERRLKSLFRQRPSGRYTHPALFTSTSSRSYLDKTVSRELLDRMA